MKVDEVEVVVADIWRCISEQINTQRAVMETGKGLRIAGRKLQDAILANHGAKQELREMMDKLEVMLSAVEAPKSLIDPDPL